jgi:hypothetical protein
METEVDLQAVYREALEAFVEKVRRDRNILAAILAGSLSYDQVWQKSDIDVLLIGRDEKKTSKDYCLVENGINIHAYLFSRGQFREQMQRALQSSFFHSLVSKSTLLYSEDESIREYYRDIQHLGAYDREMQLLKSAAFVMPTLAKAEKWFYVKKDLEYSFFWIMFLVNSLATIEVLLNHEVTGREVVHQALRFNPEFFNLIYTDLIHARKDEATIQRALDAVNGYLEERIPLLFKPLLEYLMEVGGARSSSEIDEYFRKRAQTESLAPAYEWLADKGVIEKVSAPLRLTEKSQVTVDEAAYYYDGGNLP